MTQPNLPPTQRINSAVFEAIDTNIGRLAHAGRVRPYLADMMSWDRDTAIENPAEVIGQFTEVGAVAGEGWARFTEYEIMAPPLMRGLNAPFYGIQHQMEVTKEVADNLLQATIRTMRPNGYAGRVYMTLDGKVPDHDDRESRFQFLQFASHYGLDQLWRRLETGPLAHISMEGWVNTHAGRPIAAALGKLAIHKP